MDALTGLSCRAGRLLGASGCILLLLATAQAQPPAPWAVPPVVPPSPLGPVLDPVVGMVVPAGENTTGQDLHREDVRIRVDLRITDVDYQLLGILFGGGRVAADCTATLRVEFRALGAARLDAALRGATGQENVSLSGTFGIPVDRVALTAEEVRLAGGGVLLQAVETYETQAARAYLADMMPGVAVGPVDAAWSGVDPTASVAAPAAPASPQQVPGAVAGQPVLDVRDPPIVLEARTQLRYVHRTTLAEIVEGARSDDAPARLKDRIARDEFGGAGSRGAFGLLGYGQLLKFSVPSGWTLNATVEVPAGFSIEAASSELALAQDHQSLAFALDGNGRAQLAERPALATVSSRATVTAAAFAVVGALGLIVRLPLEAAVLWVAHKRAKP